MSFLSTVGKDFKAVFSWLGSPKGQAVVAAGSALAEGLGVPAAAVNLADSWLEKIITTETLAAAAGAQTGSGTQKAAAVLNAIEPQVVAAFPSTNLKAANDALVAFLNALGAPATAVTK